MKTKLLPKTDAAARTGETETVIRELAARAHEALGIPVEKFLLALDHAGVNMRDSQGREVVDVRLPALLWDYPRDHQCLLLETAQAKSPVPLPKFAPWQTCEAIMWCHKHGVKMVLSATEKTVRFAK